MSDERVIVISPAVLATAMTLFGVFLGVIGYAVVGARITELSPAKVSVARASCGWCGRDCFYCRQYRPGPGQIGEQKK